MTKPFSQLRDAMSPEAQAKVEKVAEELRVAIEQKRRADLYPELVEAVKRLIGSLGVMIGDPDNDGDIKFARAILAKCKG